MKILYDHQAFTMQHFGGVSKCFCELICNLPKEIDYDISIKQCANEHLINSGLVRNFLPVSYDKQIYLQRFHFRGRYKLWDKVLMHIPWFQPAEKINKRYSIECLQQRKWDIVHPTFFDPYFLSYIGKKPYVVTVHDMISELYPNMEEQSQHKKKIIQNAAGIISVSENTKRDLCEMLNVPEEKVTVIYHGGPSIEVIKSKPIVREKYFLYIGNRDKYKAFDVFLAGYSSFIQSHSDVKLVCTGKPFTFSERSLLHKLGVMDSVVYFHPSDEELHNLYAYALAFVYPSEYEGFGMPILEAYAYGCPVLLNKKSCFPEIATNAAIYFDTDNKKSIIDSLVSIYNCSQQEREDLINRGYCRLSTFSWKNSAKQLAKVYQSIV